MLTVKSRIKVICDNNGIVNTNGTGAVAFLSDYMDQIDEEDWIDRIYVREGVMCLVNVLNESGEFCFKHYIKALTEEQAIKIGLPAIQTELRKIS